MLFCKIAVQIYTFYFNKMIYTRMLSIFLTNIHIDMLIFFQFYAANSLLRGEIRVMERQKNVKKKSNMIFL